MSIQSYLQALGSAGGVMGATKGGDMAQLSLGTSGQDVSNWGMMKQKSPLFFAELLREASRPGGALSDLHTQRGFASDVSGMMAGERQYMGENRRAMLQSGYGNMLGERMLRQDRTRMSSMITGRRGERQDELTENIFGGQMLMANVLQAAEARKQQVALASKGRSLARSGMPSGLEKFGEFAIGMTDAIFPG